jgi:hypothetical protein
MIVWEGAVSDPQEGNLRFWAERKRDVKDLMREYILCHKGSEISFYTRHRITSKNLLRWLRAHVTTDN